MNYYAWETTYGNFNKNYKNVIFLLTNNKNLL